MSIQITCVTKPNRYSSHEHITHVGGYGWTKTREQVIREIDNRLNSYFTKDPYTGKIAYVGVVREYGKLPYLRTYADGKYNNNLLEMAECPLPWYQ